MTSTDVTELTWQDRADNAAQSVTELFGRKLLFLPRTHLARVAYKPGRPPATWQAMLRWLGSHAAIEFPWHYWWQAHYVDCLVDAVSRDNIEAAPASQFAGRGNRGTAKLAPRLVTGIRLRNGNTFVNNYYDDMAWLALAAHRLEALGEKTGNPGNRRHASLFESLTQQFDAANTDHMGGGVFWSKKRDFKNTPATAPVALFYARTRQRAKAQALVDWLDRTLYDPAQGLYLDGARWDASGNVTIDRAVYTYNQGPVLGALLELGGNANLARVAEVVHAVDRHLTVAAPFDGVNDGGTSDGGKVLRCDGTGDGGLFTGILCRYLALAAMDARVPEETRDAAARLVTDTAEAFWQGRRILGADDIRASHRGRSIFSVHAARPAAETYPAGAVVELSTQLQAWMVLEAAAAINRA